MNRTVIASFMFTAAAIIGCSAAPPQEGADIVINGTLTPKARPYATPGPSYNPGSNVPLGTQGNPYPIDPSQTVASPDHYMSWGTFVDASGTTIFGMFTIPIWRADTSRRLVLSGYGWQQCGTAGAGC